mmetsp:Transcript_126895/g.353346  ORF Transcript_126895/g.353346 Transcript_126895/m.353346 type:complete len:226 (+) Transcript_126895:75-752(+)
MAIAGSCSDSCLVLIAALACLAALVPAAELGPVLLEDVQAALDTCNSELAACRNEGEACHVAPSQGLSSKTVKSQPVPAWPEGYGKLLRFPFGMADMKNLKEFARMIWQPDGTAATINDAVTDHGFVQKKQTRCTSEMVGVHPVGGPGMRWSAKLWTDAQSWCLAESACTGIMLYVGTHTLNCHHWCGRPQFCSGPIDDQDGVEPSAEWNLFVRDLSLAGTPTTS